MPLPSSKFHDYTIIFHLPLENAANEQKDIKDGGGGEGDETEKNEE